MLNHFPRKFLRLLVLLGILLTAPLNAFSVQAAPALPTTTDQNSVANSSSDKDDFVVRHGSQLWLNNRPFRFGGTNTYYLEYDSNTMVDNLLNTAAKSNFAVLRTWGFLDIGNQDGSNSTDGPKNGVYFQYWNGTAPAYNDGANGLQHLDYVIYKAGQLGIKLVIPFTNNWSAFGGIDQYVKWRGGQYHDEFYTDPTIQQWYQAWINHLLNHVNSYTGIAYKNDPTIMMWELANEPRCKGSGLYPPSSTCSTSTLTSWADIMSTYIKGVDRHHLVAVGDEGFYCVPGATDWTQNCGEGVDAVALTKLKNIDVMSMHLYPDSWGKDFDWTVPWIAQHIQDAKANGKAFMLGEFGWSDKSTRNTVYKAWTDEVYKDGGNGFLYWMLADKQDDGTYYPDYDGYTVYCPSPVCQNLIDHALLMANRQFFFPPVADNDSASTPFSTSVTITPTANDVAFDWAKVVTNTIDLDPATSGQQTSRTVNGQGTFQLQANGTVLFTPALNFAGTSTISYTVQDSYGRISNAANIAVTVQPNPAGTLMLYSFEDGTEGWGQASWQSPAAGSVSQTTAFHTDGSYGLEIDATGNGGWFGLEINPALDLSSKTHFKLDIQTTSASTSENIAFKVGDSWEWCQANWGYLNSNTTTTLDLDLTQNYQCNTTKPLDLTAIHAIYIYLSAGTYYIDAVRAE